MPGILTMIWSDYRCPIKLLFEVFGAYHVAKVIWRLAHQYREGIDLRYSVEDCHVSVNQVEEPLNELIVDFICLKDEIKTKLSSDYQPNDNRAIADQGSVIPAANRELQVSMLKTIGAEFREMVDSQVKVAQTHHDVTAQKQSQDERKYSDAVIDLLKSKIWQMQAIVVRLFTDVQRNGMACKALQEENFIKIQEEFKEIRDSFAKFKERKDGKTFTELSVNVNAHHGNVIRAIPLLRALQPNHSDDCSHMHPSVFLWTVSGIQQKLLQLIKDKMDIVCEEYFNVDERLKVRPSIKLGQSEEVIFVLLEFVSVEADASSWPFLHYRKYMLLDQSADAVKSDIEAIDRPDFGMNTTKYLMAPFFKNPLIFFMDELKNGCKYVKDDQLLVKVVLEPLSLVSKQVSSIDGVLLWKIEHYSIKRIDEIEGRSPWLVSEPFRTSKTGYTMQVNLYLDGDYDIETEFISIKLIFILGENDQSLLYPPKGQCVFCLIDQSEHEPKSHISMVYDHSELGKFDSGCALPDEEAKVMEWRIPRFVHRSEVEDPKYMKNDTILIKTVVKLV